MIIKRLKWLEDLLNELGWTPADLARAAGLDSAVISNIRNGKRSAGLDTITRIAAAVDHPPEALLRAAGLLPPAINIDEVMQQVIHEMEKLPDGDKEEILAFVRMKKDLRKKK